MNPLPTPETNVGLELDLRGFTALCNDVLALVTRENQALATPQNYQPSEFYELRKHLLPELESTLVNLRKRRQVWHPSSKPGGHSEEIKAMFQNIQSLVMKILSLDRENQQALLKLGLVPATHLPPAAAQRPHFVAGLYQQYANHPGGRPGNG